MLPENAEYMGECCARSGARLTEKSLEEALYPAGVTRGA